MAAASKESPLMLFFFVIFAGAAAGLGVVEGLLHREWLSAVAYACILLFAIAVARRMSLPTNTFRDHARHALRAAGLFAVMITLMTAASLTLPSNRETPITVIFFAAIFGAVFGGGAYVAIMALGAAWDAAIARLLGHR
jgi:hypothetical protein